MVAIPISIRSMGGLFEDLQTLLIACRSSYGGGANGINRPFSKSLQSIRIDTPSSQIAIGTNADEAAF